MPRRHPIGVPLLDSRTVRVMLTVLLVAAGIGFVWSTWHVLVTFLFAIFWAYLIEPVVRLVMRYLHLGLGKSIGLVYLVLCAGLAVLFLFVGPDMVQEARRLADTIPELYQKVASGQIALQLGAQHGWSNDTRVRIQQFLAAHSSDIDSLANEFAVRLARLSRNVWWLVLIPILAVFFLKDGEKIRRSIIETFDQKQQREFVDAVLCDFHLMLAHYIRSQMILSALAMVAYVAGLNALRAPYATILGIIGGLLEFIPMAGPIIAYLLMVGVALGSGYRHVLFLILFLAVWRIVQDYVASPRIIGNRLEIPPLAVLFGVLVGAELGGIIGVYLSIPAVAAVRILWRRWQTFSQQHSAPVSDIGEFVTPSSPHSKEERRA